MWMPGPFYYSDNVHQNRVERSSFHILHAAEGSHEGEGKKRKRPIRMVNWLSFIAYFRHDAIRLKNLCSEPLSGSCGTTPGVPRIWSPVIASEEKTMQGQIVNVFELPASAPLLRSRSSSSERDHASVRARGPCFRGSGNAGAAGRRHSSPP